jgi:hypothetical protein
MNEYEALRESFRPNPIRVLFIGESRPINGTFFYRGDSRLSMYTSMGFGYEGNPNEVPAFLQLFCSLGCFLVDLCLEPVNHLPRRERRLLRHAVEPTLASILIDVQPMAIVVVMKGITTSVAHAATMAHADTIPRYELPFPAQSHEQEYVRRLRDVITHLQRDGVLDETVNNGLPIHLNPSTDQVARIEKAVKKIVVSPASLRETILIVEDDETL